MKIVIFLLYVVILVIMSAASYINLKLKSKEHGFDQLHDWFNHSFQEKPVSSKHHHPKNQKVVDVVVEEMPETKATLSHTEKMRQQFLKIVQVFQQFSPEDYSLSVFDKELIQRVSIISPEEIDTMRRSAILIHTEKLKRLYLNNPNLPEELLESLRAFVEEMEAIQLQEEEVQHMGSKGELVVEAVKSATNYTTKNRVLKYRLQWKKAIVASEVLSKPKSMR
jgi:hypothetical protein